MDGIDLAQDVDRWRALTNTVMNLRVPQNAGKFLSSCTVGSLSRRAQLHESIHVTSVYIIIILIMIILSLFNCSYLSAWDVCMCSNGTVACWKEVEEGSCPGLF
jgi:hypothetical protein